MFGDTKMATTIDYILLDYSALGTPQPSLLARVDDGLKENSLASLLEKGTLLYQSEGEKLIVPERGDIVSYRSPKGKNKRYEVVVREISEPQVPDLTVRLGLVEVRK